jgi:hypothetical protein
MGRLGRCVSGVKFSPPSRGKLSSADRKVISWGARCGFASSFRKAIRDGPSMRMTEGAWGLWTVMILLSAKVKTSPFVSSHRVACATRFRIGGRSRPHFFGSIFQMPASPNLGAGTPAWIQLDRSSESPTPSRVLLVRSFRMPSGCEVSAL